MLFEEVIDYSSQSYLSLGIIHAKMDACIATQTIVQKRF